MPSGQCCCRTKALHLASSIRDERFTRLVEDMGCGRSVVGLPAFNRLPPRSLRPRVQHPGSREEPFYIAIAGAIAPVIRRNSPLDERRKAAGRPRSTGYGLGRARKSRKR
jgi:hypothetical protein